MGLTRIEMVQGMIVTLWRHGEAGDAPTDFERELSSKGEDDVGFGTHQFMQVCQQRNLPAPDVIVHSALVRTTLTAEIIAGVFSHALMMPAKGLQPGATVSDAIAIIAAHIASEPAPAHLVLVSHQPLVSQLATFLTLEAGRAPSLNPGGLVTLEVTLPGAGGADLLFWSLPPEYEAAR